MALPLTPASLAALPLITADALEWGDILLFSGRDFLSKVIEDVTNSLFGHVGIAVQINGRWFTLEAYSPLVRIVPLVWETEDYNNSDNPYPGSIAVARWGGLPPQNAAAGIAFAMQQLGKAYADLDIAKDALRNMGWPIAPEIPNGKSCVCSELVQAIYQAMGCPIPDNPHNFVAPFVAPGDIPAPSQISFIGRIL
jgi:hypothetical protein